MSKQSTSFSIRSKIWIENESGNVVFGLGRLRILEAIHRNGSIHAAAKELKMSYRAVWGRIKATEERLGRPLLVKNIGGAKGGGSELTQYALTLIKQFSEVQDRVIADSDTLCEHFFFPSLKDPLKKIDK